MEYEFKDWRAIAIIGRALDDMHKMENVSYEPVSEFDDRRRPNGIAYNPSSFFEAALRQLCGEGAFTHMMLDDKYSVYRFEETAKIALPGILEFWETMKKAFGPKRAQTAADIAEFFTDHHRESFERFYTGIAPENAAAVSEALGKVSGGLANTIDLVQLAPHPGNKLRASCDSAARMLNNAIRNAGHSTRGNGNFIWAEDLAGHCQAYVLHGSQVGSGGPAHK